MRLTEPGTCFCWVGAREDEDKPYGRGCVVQIEPGVQGAADAVAIYTRQVVQKLRASEFDVFFARLFGGDNMDGDTRERPVWVRDYLGRVRQFSARREVRYVVEPVEA